MAKTHLLALFALLLLAGCAMSVEELDAKKADLVGEQVTVKGVVQATIKLGPISGYTLKDETTGATVGVATQALPKEGETVTAKGVLMKDTLLGYYVKAD